LFTQATFPQLVHIRVEFQSESSAIAAAFSWLDALPVTQANGIKDLHLGHPVS